MKLGGTGGVCGRGLYGTVLHSHPVIRRYKFLQSTCFQQHGINGPTSIRPFGPDRNSHAGHGLDIFSTLIGHEAGVIPAVPSVHDNRTIIPVFLACSRNRPRRFLSGLRTGPLLPFAWDTKSMPAPSQFAIHSWIRRVRFQSLTYDAVITNVFSPIFATPKGFPGFRIAPPPELNSAFPSSPLRAICAS